MNDLDDEIRRAFLAVEVPATTRAALLEAPARTGWTRWLLAAVALATVGLAAAPVADVVESWLPAGFVGARVERVDVPMDPMDTWIPAGAEVRVYGVDDGWAVDHGVQRLVSSGERAALDLVDAAAWRRGPVGTVRLARAEGPLVELALRPEVEVGAGWAVSYVDVEGAFQPIEVLPTSGGLRRVRVEPRVALEVMGRDAACSPSEPQSSSWSRVELRPVDGLGEPHDRVELYDQTTGMALGPFHRRSYQLDGARLAWADLSGWMPIQHREVRAVLGTGDFVGLGVEASDGVAVGERVDLFAPEGAVLLDLEVLDVFDGGVRVAVPRQDAPVAVRASGPNLRAVRRP
ncbi:MAG: hypothetical protein H6737_29770 [Alphaproteobacteria bacterium]|nr:hypothetical protein [Alphaproteobacteria bacterium]